MLELTINNVIRELRKIDKLEIKNIIAILEHLKLTKSVSITNGEVRLLLRNDYINSDRYNSKLADLKSNIEYVQKGKILIMYQTINKKDVSYNLNYTNYGQLFAGIYSLIHEQLVNTIDKNLIDETVLDITLSIFSLIEEDKNGTYFNLSEGKLLIEECLWQI